MPKTSYIIYKECRTNLAWGERTLKIDSKNDAFFLPSFSSIYEKEITFCIVNRWKWNHVAGGVTRVGVGVFTWSNPRSKDLQNIRQLFQSVMSSFRCSPLRVNTQTAVVLCVLLSARVDIRLNSLEMKKYLGFFRFRSNNVHVWDFTVGNFPADCSNGLNCRVSVLWFSAKFWLKVKRSRKGQVACSDVSTGLWSEGVPKKRHTMNPVSRNTFKECASKVT